jgi:ABC-type arginine transport system permease subunit
MQTVVNAVWFSINPVVCRFCISNLVFTCFSQVQRIEQDWLMTIAATWGLIVQGAPNRLVIFHTFLCVSDACICMVCVKGVKITGDRISLQCHLVYINAVVMLKTYFQHNR